MSTLTDVDERTVQALEAQMEQHASDLRAAKEALRLRQAAERKAEELRLAGALHDIDARIEEDRAERRRMKLRAVNLRAQFQSQAAHQAEMDLQCTSLFWPRTRFTTSRSSHTFGRLNALRSF